VTNLLFDGANFTTSTTASIDLKDNQLIINNPAQSASVQAAVANAWNNGSWSGSGITSSSAAAANAAAGVQVYGLGYATGSELFAAGGSSTSFEGQPISSGSTVVKYTLLGDTTLKGSVGPGDLGTVLANYDGPGDWSQGNFHYGGTVGPGDLGDVLENYDGSASGNLVSGNLVKSNLATSHSVSSDLVRRSLAPALVSPDSGGVSNGSTDLQLDINASTGDVTLVDANPSLAVTFCNYNIVVNNKATNVLLVGNPADHNKGTGPIGTAPRTESSPYTGEELLSETNTTGAKSANYNSTAAAYETANGADGGPSNWITALDGFNSQSSAFGLSENYGVGATTATITIPVGGSVDLGTIFNISAQQNDITFGWSPATAAGDDQSATLYTNEAPDYSVAPEPGTLGILGLGGVMMLRRRRRSSTTGPVG